ncbi:MAG: hypothetical protein IJW37_05060 [Lachnospiraceae bacterium]|nr:hypothetical protein [Lachnospiraceae bacterium]
MAMNLTSAEFALVKEELESRKAYVSKEHAAMLADGRIDSQEFVYEMELVMGQIKAAAEASQTELTTPMTEDAAKFLTMAGYAVIAVTVGIYRVTW